MRSSSKLTVLRPLRHALARHSFSPRGRFSSSQPPVPQGAKPVSPHVGFYKDFARPIAKVLLMAMLTYQLTYWAWVKLEKDEIKKERQNEILQLENQLQQVIAHAKHP